ncbi:hypothetical protein ACI2OX_02705 [Bacillus sp. N9]
MINSQKDFYTGGVTSIFIYIFVLGILVVIQTFPFALGMSIRRKDYFVATTMMGVASSIGIGLIMYVFS